MDPFYVNIRCTDKKKTSFCYHFVWHKNMSNCILGLKCELSFSSMIAQLFTENDRLHMSNRSLGSDFRLCAYFSRNWNANNIASEELLLVREGFVLFEKVARIVEKSFKLYEYHLWLNLQIQSMWVMLPVGSHGLRIGEDFQNF